MKNLAVYLLLILLFVISCTETRNVTVFTEDQLEMIFDADSSLPMRVYKITNKDDSVLLRTKSEDVIIDPADTTLSYFVNRLYKTVTDSMSLGVGIAAPQVGILKNIIWVQRLDKENLPWEVYLNPRITQYSELKQTQREGCLSIPDRLDTLDSRAYAILIEYDKIDGSHHTEMVEGFTAVIFQHEIDHLNGILYIDHLEQEMRDALNM